MSQPPSTRPEIASGSLIDNRYIIQKLLGQGGLGRTYLAFDTRRFNETCVLKEFAPIGTGNGELEKCRDLFKREAKILHQLEHPQIPRFLACFEGDGRLFLVQEFVDGKTYSTLLQERQSQGHIFTQVEIVEWLSNLLPVLEYVHQHNIIHRDISPDNIMLPKGKNLPVLIDFGVGKQIADINQFMYPHHAAFVGKMSLVGKVGYAPREQISIGLCSPSSDLYALGVTAAVLLTGRDPSYLMDQYSLEWIWRNYCHVSNTFAQILDRMLADTPRMRYQNTQEVIADLSNSNSVNSLNSVNSVNSLNSLNSLNSSNSSSNTVTPKTSSTRILPQQLSQQESHEQELSPTIINNPPTVTESLYQQQSSNISSPTNSQYPQNPLSSPFNQNPQPYPNNLIQPANSIDTTFVQRAQQELAYHVGPMASIIVEDLLIENPRISNIQFVEELAKEIPEQKAAQEFKHRLLS